MRDNKMIIPAIVLCAFLILVGFIAAITLRTRVNNIENSQFIGPSIYETTTTTIGTEVTTTESTTTNMSTDTTSTTEDTSTTLTSTSTNITTNATSTAVPMTTLQETTVEVAPLTSMTVDTTLIQTIATTSVTVSNETGGWLSKYMNYINNGELPQKSFMGNFKATYYTPICNQQPGNTLGGSGRTLKDCSIKSSLYKGSIACRSVYESYGYNYNEITLVYLKFPEKYSEYNGIYSVDDCCGGYGIIDMYFDYNQNSPFSDGTGAVNGVELYVIL